MNDVQVLGPEHNEALLHLAGACPVEVRLRFPVPGGTLFKADRSPDYFAYLRSLPGKCSVMGLGDRDFLKASVSVIERDVIWQGKPIGAHYITDLMVHPAHRKSLVLYRLLKAVHERWDLASPSYVYQLEQHGEAGALLRGRAGLPGHRRADRIHHLGVLAALPLRRRAQYQVEEVAASGQRLWEEQFELWSRGRDLSPVSSFGPAAGERRFLVLKSDRPVAVGSLVDQTSVRRFWTVRMCLRDRALRWSVNRLASVTGLPLMSGPGEVVRRSYVGNLVYEDGHVEAAEAFLRYCQGELKRGRVPFFSLGLSERDPLLARLSSRWGLHRFRGAVWTIGFPPPVSQQPTFINLHQL